jgi:hypothetical protein
VTSYVSIIPLKGGFKNIMFTLKYTTYGGFFVFPLLNFFMLKNIASVAWTIQNGGTVVSLTWQYAFMSIEFIFEEKPGF